MARKKRILAEPAAFKNKDQALAFILHGRTPYFMRIRDGKKRAGHTKWLLRETIIYWGFSLQFTDVHNRVLNTEQRLASAKRHNLIPATNESP